MRIGVISDSHGDIRAIKKVLEDAKDINLWIHAGDYSQDAELVAGRNNTTIITVAGNCDGACKAKPDEFIELEDKKIWVTHGHRYDVKQSYHQLLWWAKQYEVDIVIFGHSHVPEVKLLDSVLLVNPGSVSKPRWPKPTYAIIEIKNKIAEAQIVEF
ncbi:metallophosphoesterase [Dendrosporobacter sp. 1207_IL3150]|uniref:metallophosphoesterase n=1 Tax=Dendrosporobacter sp. 1207_IL3150 TaxID=3084054 RepID=UPI002FDB5A98